MTRIRGLFRRGFLAGCASVLMHALALAAPAASSLPETELFFRKPALSDVELSPSGKRIAFLAPAPNGRMALAVVDAGQWDKPRFVAGFNNVDLRDIEWVNDDRLVFSTIDLQRELAEQKGPGLWAVNADGSNFRRLIDPRWDFVREANAAGLRTLAWNHGLLRTVNDGSADVIVERYAFTNTGDLRSTLPLRLNTESGEVRPLVSRMPGGDALHWWVDAQGIARLVRTVAGSGTALYWRRDEASGWEVVHREPTRYSESLLPLRVTVGGDVYALAQMPGKQKLRALYRYFPEQRKLDDKPLVTIDGFDFSGSLVLDAQGRRLLGVHFQADAPGTAWLDPDLATLQKQVDEVLPNTVNMLRCRRCEIARYVLVVSEADRVPAYYSVYDRQAKRLVPVGSSRPWLQNVPMGRRDFVRIPARDGLELPTYITRPAGRGPWPTVVLVHGGPYVRGGYWEWDAESQFLASRGYLVIETEFRGSEGFGLAHLEAGFKQWGLKMQDDVADATEWAIKQGHAQRERICIAGASYGGYATLMGLLRYPELYRCGINWVGVTDINLMYTISWSDMSDAWGRYGMPVLVGDREKDAEQLKATSPLLQADRIHQPILLAYGGADRRVPIEHGRKFRAAVQRHNNAVEWIEYLNEGHGWLTTANQVDFWNRVEQFLARNLADRSAAALVAPAQPVPN